MTGAGTTWIALLRGINVSGQKPMPMAQLRALCADLGWRDTATYIQSGNVVFASDANDEAELGHALQTAIGRQFGYDVSVFVRRAGDWTELAANNPFVARGDCDPARLYVALLATPPGRAAVTKLGALRAARDEAHVRGRTVYLHCPDGYGRSQLNNAALERGLGVAATTRNWRTVEALLLMVTR